MNGVSFTATAEDLAGLAARYDAASSPAPVVIGHPKTDTPAYGWVESFSWDADSERLIAEIGELEPQFADAVSEGRYKKISMSFHMPGSTSNPAGDALYPKHVGFLGGAAPAVPGLQPVSFEGSNDGTVTVELSEFAEPALKDVATLFRKFREWLIDERGVETADQVVPDFYIRWIDDAGDPPLSDFSEHSEEPSMARSLLRGKRSQPQPAQSPYELPEDDAAFADREAQLSAREQELADREAALAHADHVAFAETLVSDARMPSGNVPRVVALLDCLSAMEPEEVSFADGDKKIVSDPLQLMKDLLRSQPKLVEFGELDLGEEPAGEADPSTLAAEALAFQASQRDAGVEISISDAVTHVEQKRGIGK